LVAYATIIAAPDLDAADLANVEVMLQRSFDQVDRAICQLSQSAAPPTPALPSWPTLTTSRWRSSTILTLRSLRATLDAATVRNVSTTLIQPGLEFRLGWSGWLCGIELSEAAGFLV